VNKASTPNSYKPVVQSAEDFEVPENDPQDGLPEQISPTFGAFNSVRSDEE